MLEELCFVSVSSISTIDFAPNLGYSTKLEVWG